MKTTLKTLIISALLASTFTGCAKDGGVEVSDIALSPVYAVMAVGYVATKATTIVVGGAVAATGSAVKTVSNVASNNSNSDASKDATIVANKD